MRETTTRLLESEAQRLGRTLCEPGTALLVRYLELLCQWGRVVNLTGSPDVATVVARHLADALMLSDQLPAADISRCVDVGSGAGLPGLLLAILRPDLELTLVEPRQRRCAFLRTVTHALELRVHLAPVALEQLTLSPCDAAWSRATWSPTGWLRRAVPLVRPSGLVVAFLGREPAPEPPPGLTALRQIPYALADGAPRALAVYTASRECFT